VLFENTDAFDSITSHKYGVPSIFEDSSHQLANSTIIIHHQDNCAFGVHLTRTSLQGPGARFFRRAGCRPVYVGEKSYRQLYGIVQFVVCSNLLTSPGLRPPPASFYDEPVEGAFASLVLAVAGPLSGNFVFWTIPPTLMAGSAVAGAIALINSIGSVSGWVGPSVVGRLADLTGKTSTGLYVIAGLEVLAAILILLFVPRRSVSPDGTAPQSEK
jgi:hypothetical protein